MICLKTKSPFLSPDRRVTDHTGLRRKWLSDQGWKPKVLLDDRDISFHEQLGQEPNCLRTKTFENRDLTELYIPMTIL